MTTINNFSTTFLTLLIFIVTLKSNAQQNYDNAIKSSIANYDTTKIAILKFDNSKSFDNIFDTTYNSATLNNEDIRIIEKLIMTSVNSYNAKCRHQKYSNIRSIHQFKKYYKRQYVPVVNKLGEKEVYIFCFCSHSFDDKLNWKHKTLLIDDGGSCVFRLKINLTHRKIISDISINGSA